MANESTAKPEPESEAIPLSKEELEHANQVVQRNVYWAMGAGVLPMPVFDIVAITAVQLKMLRELSEVYNITFRDAAAKKAVVSLIVGVGGVGLGGLLGASLAKFVPIIGQSLGSASVSVVSGMLTHAIGQTFVMHFESGGTLLDFKATAMRAYFQEQFGKSKAVVTDLRSKGSEDAAQSSAAT